MKNGFREEEKKVALLLFFFFFFAGQRDRERTPEGLRGQRGDGKKAILFY